MSYGRTVDNFSTIVAAPGYTHGSGSLPLASGAGTTLGALPSGRVWRFTAGTHFGTRGEVILGIFEATGRTGDTLTGVTASAGYSDVDLPAGTQVQVRWTARHAHELQDAVSALEAAPSGIAIGDAVSGSTAGRVLFVGAGPALADSAGLTFDATATTLSLKPGSRSYTISANDGAGAMVFGREDATNELNLILGDASAKFTPSVTSSVLNFSSPGGSVIFCPKEGGGSGPVQFGRREADSSNAVGASAEFWPAATQTTPVLASVVPGGGTYVFAAYRDGDLHTDLQSASKSGLTITGAASQSAPLGVLRGLSSTSTARDLGYLDAGFVVSTDASYTGYVDLDAVDHGGRRKGLRVASDGTQALIGFYGAIPVAKAAAPTTLSDVITILRNLGLCS